LSKISTF